MPVWQTRPVDDQSTIDLVRWAVMEFPGISRHLIGTDSGLGFDNGRVSTPIESYRTRTRADPPDVWAVATTRSGRTYRLIGPQGADSEAWYVWGRWCAAVGVDPDIAVDVTPWDPHD